MTYDTYLELCSSIPDNTELLDGEPSLMASPIDKHQIAVKNLLTFFGVYLGNGRCTVYSDLDVILDSFNAPRPDILIVCDDSKIKEGKCYGVPDFIAEVLSPSTHKIDLGLPNRYKKNKLKLYQKYGVPEYWIINADKKSVIVNLLVGSRYVATKYFYPATDILYSQKFPSFPVSLKGIFNEFNDKEFREYLITLINLGSLL